MVKHMEKNTVRKNKKMTYEEFLEFSENSENRYEFIDGEIYLLASPSYAHQSAVGGIFCLHVPVVQREKMQADGGAF